MCPGSEFQILEASEVKLFVPKVVWFGLGVFKLCCCCAHNDLLDVLGLNISLIKTGLK